MEYVQVKFKREVNLGPVVFLPGETQTLPRGVANSISDAIDILGPSTADQSLAGAPRSLVSGDGSRRAAILGHSRVQENTEQTATAIYNRQRWWHIAQALAGHRFDLVQNAGISGQNLAQISARVAAGSYGVGFGMLTASSAISNTTVGILGLNPRPDWVFVEAAINDLLSSVSASTCFSRLTSGIIDPLRAAGINIILIADELSSNASGLSAANAREIKLYRDMLQAYASANRGVWFCDFYGAMASPTSAYLETASADFRDGNLHPQLTGGLKAAIPLAALMQQLLPPRGDLLPCSNAETSAYDSAIPQLNVNPLLTGSAAISATGYTGNGPSNAASMQWVRGGSATAVGAMVARADGYGQDLQLTTTFTAASETIEVRWPSYHAQVVSGQKYRAVCEVNFTGPSGAVLAASDNLRAVTLGIQYNDGTTNYFVQDLASLTSDTAWVGSRKLLLRTPEMTIPAGGTPTTFRALVTVMANGPGSPVVSIGRVGLIRTP